jgi:glutaredoxin
LEFLARAIRQEEEIKAIQIGKEDVKLPLFTDDMISYLKDLENFTKKTPIHHKHLYQSSRIPNQFINISSLSTYQQQRLIRNIGKTIPFIIASKGYLGINLTKDVNDLYNENYTPLKKEIKNNYRRQLPCLWIGRINIVKMVILPKAIYMFNAIPIKFQWHSSKNQPLSSFGSTKDCE